MPIPQRLQNLNHDWIEETSCKKLKLIIPFWIWCKSKLSFAWWQLCYCYVSHALLDVTPFYRFFGLYHSLPVVQAIYIPNFQSLRITWVHLHCRGFAGQARPGSILAFPTRRRNPTRPLCSSGWSILADGLGGFLAIPGETRGDDAMM